MQSFLRESHISTLSSVQHSLVIATWCCLAASHRVLSLTSSSNRLGRATCTLNNWVCLHFPNSMGCLIVVWSAPCDLTVSLATMRRSGNQSPARRGNELAPAALIGNAVRL